MDPLFRLKMEFNNMQSDYLSVMSENQLRNMVKDLRFKLKEMERIHMENYILTEENKAYKVMEAEHFEDKKASKKELIELRKQLQMRKDLYRTVREERTISLKREEQLNQVIKEKGYLIGQLPRKEECRQLKKKNRDLEVAMSKQEKHLMDQIHVLEGEVEKLQKKLHKLQEKNTNLQEEKNRLQDERSTIQEDIFKDKKHEDAQKQRALILESRCSELEKRLQRAFKELCVRHPQNKWTFDMGLAYEKNSEALAKLYAERKRAERKDHIAKEKEEQNLELKHQLSKLLPLDLICHSQCLIREQSSRISALKAQVRSLQLEVEEDKRERGRLRDECSAIKKKFLNEKRQNADLREALRKVGVEQVHSREKSGSIHVLPRREGGVNTRMETGKPFPARLPSILAKSQLQPAVTALHFRAAILPKSSCLVQRQKSDARNLSTPRQW